MGWGPDAEQPRSRVPQPQGPVPHLSCHNNSDGPGKGLARGLWSGTGRPQYQKHLSQAQQAAATGIPSRRHPLTAAAAAVLAAQRQEEASAQRKTAQEAGPPPLPAPSLPPAALERMPF